MRRLILFRHAKAEPHGTVPTDHARALAPRGTLDAPAMGKRLAELPYRIDLAICSTSSRTQQTWDLAAGALPYAVPVQEDWRVYEASVDRLLEIVRGAPRAAETVVLVGHNPGLEELVGMLADAASITVWRDRGRAMPTAAIAVLEAETRDDWAEIRPVGMRLVHFMKPREDKA